MATELLAGHERRARAAEEVEHVLARLGGVLQRAGGQLDGLLRQVDHLLRRDLLHDPEVRHVGRAVEHVRRAFLPAVEAPLVRTHEVLAREHGVLLVPDDGLREVEPRLAQRRRVVGHVGVAAPDVGRSARHQDAGGVAEPGAEHPFEGLVGDEVVGERSVLRAHLARRGLGLARVACEVERLVVALLGRGERREPRADRVVAPGFDLHVVGRVGVEQVDARTTEQTIEVGFAPRVATEQPVVAKHPEVAGLRDRIVGRLGHVVLDDGRGLGGEQVAQRLLQVAHAQRRGEVG